MRWGSIFLGEVVFIGNAHSSNGSTKWLCQHIPIASDCNFKYRLRLDNTKQHDPSNLYMNINLWMSTRRYTICNIFDTVVHSPAFKLRTVRPYLSITQTLERYACMHACMHVHACLCGCVCNACIVYIVYIQYMYCYSIHCLLYAMLELHI